MSNRVKPTGVHTNIDAHVIIEGQLVSQKISQVVQAIKEYEPNLDVMWVPDRGREEGVAAFKIYFNDEAAGERYLVMNVMKEEDMDYRVLARLIAGDQRNGKITWDDFQAHEQALKRVKHQEYLDKLEEAQDLALSLIKTPLNTYRVNKDLVVKEGIPHNAAHLDDQGLPKKGSEKRES